MKTINDSENTTANGRWVEARLRRDGAWDAVCAEADHIFALAVAQEAGAVSAAEGSA